MYFFTIYINATTNKNHVIYKGMLADSDEIFHTIIYDRMLN